MRPWRALCVAAAAAMLLSSCSVLPPSKRAPALGHLAPCPSSPNCVSSEARGSHHVAPLPYLGSEKHAEAVLVGVVRHYPRTHIVERRPGYLYATFTTRWLRFTDDVEFWFRPRHHRIDVRSASRIGYYDFGKNRSRVHALHQRFEKALTRAGHKP